MSGAAAAVPTPAITAGDHHSPPSSSSSVTPFSPNLHTQSSDFIDQSKRRASVYSISNQTSFGPVPSQIEVQNAIVNLQRVMNGFCASHSELDGIGEITDQDTYRTLMKSLGQKRLLDAYHLLQTDPLVQKLVLSISLDTGVWDAILKNDAVQDLQGSSSHAATKEENMRHKQEPDSLSPIIKWIFAFMKSTFIEFIEKLEIYVFETLHSVSKKKSTVKHDDLLQEKIRSSLLLSVVVLVIVIVTRSIPA